MTVKEKLDLLTAGNKSNWVERTEWRIANQDWLDVSAKIAIKMLMKMRYIRMSKEALATKTNISLERINEIVKGSANLTLQEMIAIENSLNITIVNTLNITIK